MDHFRPTEPTQGEAQPRERKPTRYEVNVLVNNKDGQGAPVVVEQSPTYYNLAGRLEYRPVAGGALTDFTLIKPGALHRANGGCLVVQATR